MSFIYSMVYEALADFFTLMTEIGANLFDLGWVKAALHFFNLFGWGLFVAGLVVAIFDTAIEYQTMGRLNIKKQILPFLYGLLAVNLFTTVPVELFRFSVNLQNTFAKDLANKAITMNLDIQHMALKVLTSFQIPAYGSHNVLLNLLILICLGYCVIKCFFSNIKRGGILLTQIAVGSLYLFSLPRGYSEGFTGWAKQIVALCFTTFMQTTLLLMGLITMETHPLLGLGVMLSANEVPRIAQHFGLDTSTRVNTLRQKEGFISCMPCGHNAFGTQFERVLPASAVANCYPFNYSGKTDPHGFYLGKDKYGTNIIVDFDRRSDDKTNSNVLILGNSGQGKSYLLKLILTNTRMAGKSVICLDAEQEYKDLCNNLGGCYIDLMSGQYIINPLEPKEWSDNASDAEDDAPEAFRKATRLSQHISFLKDFFRVYKDFDDAQIDALEILLTRLYGKFGIHDDTDYSKLTAGDYPVMADLYEIVESEYMKYEKGTKSLFTEDLLRELCLGLNSMCVGAESKFFNGHTNISDDRFICFGVKGLMEANKKLKDAMLFNILSFMNHKLLTKGNTAASIDELYLFLTNLTAIEYIRNASKRVRKKDSSIILASQNIEDFLLPEIKEMTKPLFSIPTHQFLFNGGNINAKDYIDALQLEESEFDLIKYPERGTCLFKCGNERYLLQVKAPEYKAKLFGDAGGR